MGLGGFRFRQRPRFLAVLGLTMFGLGIRHGLMPLGEQALKGFRV